MPATAPPDSRVPGPLRGRPRPALFQALGTRPVPPEVRILGTFYRLVRVLKHDSWAATALYEESESPSESGSGQRIVCKFNRQQPILGLPMGWLGRLLARREMERLEQFSDLPQIPTARGPVEVDGAPQHHVAAHDYVEGRPLRCGEERPDIFYDELERTLRTMHGRGVAYVDLHKAENVIVGSDGRPYLIDFQISFQRPAGWLGKLWPVQAVFQILAQSDLYHLRKHRVLHLRSRLPAGEFTRLLQRPWWIRWHRSLAEPARECRRRLLVLLGVRRGTGRAESEHQPEVAVQLRMAEAGHSTGQPHSSANPPSPSAMQASRSAKNLVRSADQPAARAS